MTIWRGFAWIVKYFWLHTNWIVPVVCYNKLSEPTVLLHHPYYGTLFAANSTLIATRKQLHHFSVFFNFFFTKFVWNEGNICILTQSGLGCGPFVMICQALTRMPVVDDLLKNISRCDTISTCWPFQCTTSSIGYKTNNHYLIDNTIRSNSQYLLHLGGSRPC